MSEENNTNHEVMNNQEDIEERPKVIYYMLDKHYKEYLERQRRHNYCCYSDDDEEYPEYCKDYNYNWYSDGDEEDDILSLLNCDGVTGIIEITHRDRIPVDAMEDVILAQVRKLFG
jgi:hypothetical protein